MQNEVLPCSLPVGQVTDLSLAYDNFKAFSLNVLQAMTDLPQVWLYMQSRISQSQGTKKLNEYLMRQDHYQRLCRQIQAIWGETGMTFPFSLSLLLHDNFAHKNGPCHRL